MNGHGNTHPVQEFKCNCKYGFIANFHA